jgi:predicted dehydrogenase
MPAHDKEHNMRAKVRVGVVGTSWYPDWMHLPSLKSHPQAEVVALCGRNRARAEELAGKFDIPHVFTDYREMIAHAGLNALVVATPDDTHFPITMEALDAGLHVVCEKPLALTAAQARVMAETAAAKGVKHMTFFTLRWLPAHRYLKELLEQGYIGRCYHCHIQHFIGYGRSGGRGWRFDPKRALGVLGDLGSHAVDLARWYVGDIAAVSAQLGTFVERHEADGRKVDSAWDSAMLTLRFTDGAHGLIHVSVVGHVGERGIQQRIELHGEAGTLEAGLALNHMEIRGVREGESGFQPLPVPNRFWGEADRSDPFSVFVTLPVGDRAFIDAILADRAVSPDFFDGWKVQEVLEAAIESDRTGKQIVLQNI